MLKPEQGGMRFGNIRKSQPGRDLTARPEEPWPVGDAFALAQASRNPEMSPQSLENKERGDTADGCINPFATRNDTMVETMTFLGMSSEIII